MDYEKFLNPIARNRRCNIIIEFLKTMNKETICFGGGLPRADLFPFNKLTFDIDDGTTFTIEGAELKGVLQYQQGDGIPELTRLLKHLQREIHHPPPATEANSTILVTTGSQDGVCKCAEMMLTPDDYVVMEKYAYPGTTMAVLPLDAKFLIVDGDENGMRTDMLREKLESWTKPMPKFLYINPTGSNPTGTVLSLERKREIYSLCSKYDILILEDDPYFVLQYDCGDELIPSFLSMDTDGRVIRFDSFSKIVSPGMRLAFVTGPKPLIDRLLWHCQASVQHTSSLSQVLAQRLLSHWGIRGFMDNARRLRNFYTERRNAMQRAAEKHLKDLCEWNVPGGGMFFWLKMKNLADTRHLVIETCYKKRNVLFVPGYSFSVYPDEPSPYIRAAFALPSDEEMDFGFAKLAEAIREEIQRTSNNGLVCESVTADCA